MVRRKCEVISEDASTPKYEIKPQATVYVDGKQEGETTDVKNDELGTSAYTFRFYLDSEKYKVGQIVEVQHDSSDGTYETEYSYPTVQADETGRLYIDYEMQHFSTVSIKQADTVEVPVVFDKNIISVIITYNGGATDPITESGTKVFLPRDVDIEIEAIPKSGYAAKVSAPAKVSNEGMEIKADAYIPYTPSGPSYFYLALKASEGASAEPTCDKDLSKGYTSTTTFTVTAAAPAPGYEFTGWFNPALNSLITTDQVYTITMSSSRTLEARYKKVEMDTAAKSFIEAVDSTISPVPTWQDRATVDALMETWNNLADAQKTLPEVAAARDKLDTAIQAVEASEAIMKQYREEVNEWTAELDRLPENLSLDDKAAIEALRAGYDSFADVQKEMVSEESLQKLDEAEKRIKELEAAEEEAAEKFTAAVNAIPGAKAGEGKALLDNATDIYNTMTDSQKALISDETMALYNEALAAFGKNRTFRSGEAYYKVLGNGDVTYLRPADQSVKSAAVPNQVKKGRFLFKVIKVSNNAFRNCENLEWAVINKNVYVLGQNIFARTPKLTKVAIKGSGLRSGKVADAFFKAGKNGKVTVKVPENKVGEYTALLRDEGKLNGSVKAA